ncbi:hypothetical protein imdm_1482 [gamma proteobacterium IMCC2047]|nr:hypothetical protein imdm_1482 [gamma proteobacterium IMCC2047]
MASTVSKRQIAHQRFDERRFPCAIRTEQAYPATRVNA